MLPGGSLRYEQTVTKIIEKEFEARGLKLITFKCQLGFSKKVTDKIDSRNEVNTNVTVIDQRIIEQRKKNELVKLEAEYNKTLSSGITPELLAQQALEKWNGVLPSTWSGSGLPFVKTIK